MCFRSCSPGGILTETGRMVYVLHEFSRCCGDLCLKVRWLEFDTVVYRIMVREDDFAVDICISCLLLRLEACWPTVDDALHVPGCLKQLYFSRENMYNSLHVSNFVVGRLAHEICGVGACW